MQLLDREVSATDERMISLLEPYAGQGDRVTRLVASPGHSAPTSGPSRPIVAMARS